MITSPMQANEYNVVDSFWFNYIGIVKVKTSNGEFKYYIGQGDGNHQQEDEQTIARTGTPIQLSALKMFLGI